MERFNIPVSRLKHDFPVNKRKLTLNGIEGEKDEREENTREQTVVDIADTGLSDAEVRVWQKSNTQICARARSENDSSANTEYSYGSVHHSKMRMRSA